jgi:hypothetical protein
MTGNRNDKRGKVIANIIKVQEFLFRVADHDWEQELQEREGHR